MEHSVAGAAGNSFPHMRGESCALPPPFGRKPLRLRAVWIYADHRHIHGPCPHLRATCRLRAQANALPPFSAWAGQAPLGEAFASSMIF